MEETLRDIKTNGNKPHISEELLALLKDREGALAEYDTDKGYEIHKKIQKQNSGEKRNHIHTLIVKDLDLRDRWSGIRWIPFRPIPYVQKTQKGERIRIKNRAEAAATHLYEIWKREDTLQNTKGDYIIKGACYTTQT